MVHCMWVPPHVGSSGDSVLAVGEFQDDFHKFAVEWDQEGFRWLLDDVVYFTRYQDEIRPWTPFDERFHILLNLAVGGNWPGYPDSTTQFPQTLLVDYVRVYKHPDRLAIKGERNLKPYSQAVPYEVEQVSDWTYDWAVPDGATIVSGQGIHRITIDWGMEGGNIQLTVGCDCGNREVRRFIHVGTSSIYCDFDAFQRSFVPFGGCQMAELSNPFPENAVDTSIVGRAFKPLGAESWSGIYADLPDAMDLFTYPYYSLRVRGTRTGIVKLKLEDRHGNAPPIELDQSLPMANNWQELEFRFFRIFRSYL